METATDGYGVAMLVTDIGDVLACAFMQEQPARNQARMMPTRQEKLVNDLPLLLLMGA